MFRILRAVVVVLVLCLFAGSCQILSWTMTVPSQVAMGSIFVLDVSGTSTTTYAGPTAVLQLPTGFEILGAVALGDIESSFVAGGGVRDELTALSTYLAEPGHFLASFRVGQSHVGQLQTSLSAQLRVYLRAPAVTGTHQVKLALGILTFSGSGGYQHQHPAGITDFAAITASAHVRPLQVAAVPPPTPFAIATLEHWGTPNTYQRIVTGDLDGDGRDDVVLSDALGHRALLSRSDGWTDITGSLPAATSYIPYPVADFDGDGFGDLVFTSSVSPFVTTVMWGSGTPAWTPGPPLASNGTAGGAVGDIDGDGLPDLLLPLPLGFLRSNGDRTFTPFPRPSGIGAIAAVADLNQDGHPELVTWGSGGTAILWRHGGTGVWTQVAQMFSGSGLWNPLLVFDINEDGRPDLVRGGSHVAYWMQGNNVALFGTQTLQFDFGVARDFDRDGFVDLALGRGHPQPFIKLMRRVGVGVFADVPLSQESGFQLPIGIAGLSAPDFDGDTFPDLVAAPVEGALIWRNTLSGAGSYGAACAGSGAAAPQLAVQGAVVPGQSVTVQVSGAVPHGPGLLWAGLSRRTWAGLPLLPLDLEFLGAPGCTLLAEPSVIVPLSADATGVMTKVVPLPALLPTESVTFFLQGTVLAPGANPLQFLFTQGVALKLQ